MDLSINNVINIQVSQPGVGAGEYNTSNLALFTRETAQASFGTDGYKLYLGPTDVAADFGTDSTVYKMALAIFSQQPNILANNGYLAVIQFDDGSGTETLGEAITRTVDTIHYFGALSTEMVSETDGKAAAAVVQPLSKIIGVVSRTETDLDADGYFDDIRLAGQTHTRCLYHGSDNDEEALLMLASYFGRGLSVNFQGANTTITMQLKDLAGVIPTGISQTIVNKAKAVGADVYASIQGVPKLLTSGANEFFDDVYNLLWFTGSLEIAGFNLLAQTSTKIPQTEPGMDSLKSAYRKVCEQGIINRFLAPGSWTSPDTFGQQADFYENILQRGYYIYSQPVAQQNPTAREAREAPLVQIAIKYAGAMHSSTVIVNINK